MPKKLSIAHSCEDKIKNDLFEGDFWKDALWAKKERKNNECYWLPLYVHLADTAHTCSFLWEHWISDSVKNLISDSIDGVFSDKLEFSKKIFVFLGAIHDIGKATPQFQLKTSFKGDSFLDSELRNNLETFGYKDTMFYKAKSDLSLHHSVLGAFIAKRNGVNDCVCSIISGHHGKPTNFNSNLDESRPSAFYQVENKNSDIYEKWLNAQNEIFKWALNFSEINDVKSIPLISQTGQMLLCACLIFADWLSSNENYFPLINLNQDKNNINTDRSINGLSKRYFNKTQSWNPQPININTIYQKRFSNKNAVFSPRSVQKTMVEEVNKASSPGLVILEAPMGVGKTEAALIVAEQLAYKTNKNGIFFALPTQATSNAIFKRVKSWLKKIEDDEKIKSIRLMHSKSYLNGDFTNLKPIEFMVENNQNNEKVIVKNDYFDFKKLSILDDFIVGTIDQILLMGLKQKHVMLKHLGLAGKVLIIDEVHAYDAYMSTYLYKAITWLASYNVPIIILSATLPIAKRNELVKSYMIGKNYKYKKIPKPNNYSSNENYPLLTLTDDNKIIQTSNFKDELRHQKEISINKISTKDFNKIYDIINQQKQYGGIIGIFTNTVKKAQEIVRKLEKLINRENILLIHSQFIDSERSKKEKELLAIAGKFSKDRSEFKVVVGTQVMEQSLDIDFDLIFTELAPMDLLIQRLGRLFRHEETKRPSNLKEPKAYILNVGNFEFDKATTYIYKKFLLFKTEYFLPDNRIVFPDDISPLVQSVYKDDEIDVSIELKSAYEIYKKEYEAYIENKKEKAKVFGIANPKNKIGNHNNLYNLLSNDQINDISAYAQVRDTLESLEVICMKKINNEYYFVNGEKIIDFKDKALKISRDSIRLPLSVILMVGIDNIIEDLENYYVDNLYERDQINLLRNNLAIVFDEDDNYYFENVTLHYDEFYGLSKIENIKK